MLNFIRKDGKILLVSFIIGLLFAGGVAAYTFVYSATVQRDIAENVIRFHVMAHSDSPEEQDLKEYVRIEILEEFAVVLSESECLEATRATLASLLPDLQAHAEGVIRRAGFEHEVSAEMATVFFPTQFYGNIAFPPGNYEAVQIIIGDGGGQNWWCLMFPPLCYIDMTATEAGRERLLQSVSAEGFQLLMHQEESSPEVVVRFRIVEWWQNRRRPAANPPANQPGQQAVRR